MRLLFVLGGIFLLSGCGLFTSSHSDTGGAGNDGDKLSEISSDVKLVKAAVYYGDSICVSADPEFWENYFYPDEQGSDPEQEALNLFYSTHGYLDEAEASAAAQIYWSDPSFKQIVRTTVADSCSSGVVNAGVNVDEILANPTPR